MYALVSGRLEADVVRAAGADEVVLAEGFRDSLAELLSGHGVDAVEDPVRGGRFTDSLRDIDERRATGKVLLTP